MQDKIQENVSRMSLCFPPFSLFFSIYFSFLFRFHPFSIFFFSLNLTPPNSLSPSSPLPLPFLSSPLSPPLLSVIKNKVVGRHKKKKSGIFLPDDMGNCTSCFDEFTDGCESCFSGLSGCCDNEVTGTTDWTTDCVDCFEDTEVCKCFFLSFFLSQSLSVSLSLYLSLSIYTSFYLCVSLSFCLCLSLSLCISFSFLCLLTLSLSFLLSPSLSLIFSLSFSICPSHSLSPSLSLSLSHRRLCRLLQYLYFISSDRRLYRKEV